MAIRSFLAFPLRGEIKENLEHIVNDLQGVVFKDKTKQTFKKIILYKSVLTQQGPIYEALDEFEW